MESDYKFPSSLSCSSNLLAQKFAVSRPDYSCLTLLKTRQGWLYLTVMIDFVGVELQWGSLSKTMFTKDAVIVAWKMAAINKDITEPLLFHSK
jgi:hypothetical protein